MRNPLCFEEVAGFVQGIDKHRAINALLVEVLRDLISAVEESNQIAGLDFSQNEQVVVDRARALIASVTGC